MPVTDEDLRAASVAGPLGGRRLRILWITPFWPIPSMPTAMPQREPALLAARTGHTVVMLGMTTEQPEPTLVTHPNLIEEPYLEPGDGPKRQLRGMRFMLGRARAHHAEAPFDFAYVRFAHPVGISAAVVAGALGIPLIYQEEAPDLARVNQRLIEKVAFRTMKYRASFRCASGPLIAQATAELLDRPVYPIPLPIDVDRFDAHTRPLPADGDVELIAVGRLHDQKGTDCLIEAMAKLPERFRLSFVGAGDDRPAYEAQVRNAGLGERVRFLGPKPPSEIPALLAAADIFVLPSTVESFCVAAAEALAAGLPVVTTRCGGPEYFVGTDDGVVVEPRDPEALAAAIADVAGRPDDWDHAGIAARAAARFGPVPAMALYEAMYAHVIGVADLPAPGPFGPLWFT